MVVVDKEQITKEVSKLTGIKKPRVKPLLFAFIEMIENAVEDEGSITVLGFGRFYKRHKKERQSGRWKGSAEPIIIKARSYMDFTYSPIFKKSIVTKTPPRYARSPHPLTSSMMDLVEGYTRIEVSDFIRVLIIQIARHLIEGNQIAFRKFGTFSSAFKYDTPIANPRTREIFIKSVAVKLHFKTSPKRVVIYD